MASVVLRVLLVAVLLCSGSSVMSASLTDASSSTTAGSTSAGDSSSVLPTPVFGILSPSGETRPQNCTAVKQIFQLKNITVAVPDTPINGSGVCRSGVSCCTPEMEVTLQQTVTKELHGLLHHKFQSIHGMLHTTATALQEHVSILARESENKTMSVFAEVYKRMWSLAKGPVSELYGSLVSYLEKAQKIPTELPPAVPTDDALFLEKSVLRFFTDMFPLIYHQAVHHLDASDFTPGYKDCLREAVEKVQPYGDVPKTLASDVAKSFEATKVLMEALSLGIEVLNGTDRVMSGMPDNPDSCREALVRLYYCPRCLGLPARVKPCNGYCLNVMRGCLTQQRTTELDLPWSNFLLETERLVRELSTGRTPTIEPVLMGFSSTISDAIMHATMNGPELEKKVKKACGAPKLAKASDVKGRDGGEEGSDDDEGSVVTRVTVTTTWGGKMEGSGLDRQLKAFLQASTKARGFYANLAEALCSDDSFAETRDTADCWNGHRVGEYTKALVRPGLDAQKYNPELKWREAAPDPSIRQLSDKLRHMRQVVVSRVGDGGLNGPSLESDSQLREGSGSGGWPTDDDDNDWPDQGSGSGAEPNSINGGGSRQEEATPKKTLGGLGNSITGVTRKKDASPTGGSSSMSPSLFLGLLCPTLLLSIRLH